MLDVTIKGQALNSFGLTASDTISGLGLNTFGFLWACADIWSPDDPVVSTNWTTCTGSVVDVETCID